MIDFYIEHSPAVIKVGIALEECGLEYRCRHISVANGMQHDPEFRRISPNGKIPVILDHAPADGGEPFPVFESGAIIVYLAEKAGKFLPTEPRARSRVLQWLFWQSSGLSPMSGQAIHFLRYAPEEAKPYGQLRYLGEVRRHWEVLDKHLEGRDYIADDYSIADMGTFTWVNMYDRYKYTLDDYPNLKRWWTTINDRPQVKNAYARIVAAREEKEIDQDEFRRNMFGAAAEHMPRTGVRG